MIRFALALVALTGMAAAQEGKATRVSEILDTARAECAAERAEGAPETELEVMTGAITWTDLDGGAEPDDAIVDFNRIMCSATYSLWHGSGGSIIHLVLNGETSRSWSGGLWRLTEFNGQPVVLIGRHGTWCDSYGARGCVQAILADQDGFWTVTETAPLEELED